LAVLFVLGVVVGTISLVLNIPLFYKLYRERVRLKELGLASLSESLWKESRRSRWISRAARGAPSLLVYGITLLLAIGSLAIFVKGEIGQIFLLLFCADLAALLFFTRYLRNQRERIDLAASAEELKQAFQGLQQRAGKAEVVSVPSELLERAARIES